MTTNRATTVSRFATVACILAFMLGLPAPVSAQQALEEVTVSARKREESLQEIPLSVAVFTPEALRERNIQTVYDVATFTPNFNFNRSAVGRRLDAPSIRGQFTPQQNFGSEGNVAFYVDGAYISGTASGLTIDNLERVEVLRGPQAAQFGRGAFAGAINYVTKAPNPDKLEGELYLKAGEHNNYKTSGFLSGPLIGEKLLFFASASWETSDGEWQNSMNPCKAGQTADQAKADGCVFFPKRTFTFWPDGQPVSTVQDDSTALGGESTWNTTGKLVWSATENLTFTGKAEYGKADDEHFASLFHPQLNCYLPTLERPDLPGWWCGELKPHGLHALINIADLREGATSFFAPIGAETVTAPPAPFIGTRTTSQRYLAQAQLALGEWDVTATGTINRQNLESYRDLDRSPYLGPLFANLFDAGEEQSWKDHSEEVRVTSPLDQPIRGSAGAYYFTSDNFSTQREFTGFCNRVEYGLPYIDGKPSWNLNATKENLSFFGGLDYDVGEDVTVAVEGRYAKDSPVQRAPSGITATTNYYSFTPRVTVSWQAADDLNVYGLVAKGNKPGGFFFAFFDAPVVPAATLAALADGRAIIKEENAWTYEVGAKTQWLDRRLTANVAVYYIDWKNQAINEVANIDWNCADTGLATAIPMNFIKNAGKSRVTGTEIEMTLAATDNLTLTLNYGLQDTKLLQYNSLTLLALTGDGDASGNEAPYVPKNTVTASATYRHSLGDGAIEWFLRSDYVYNSKTWIDAENKAYVGDINLVNARIGVENERWLAAIYLDNVLDEDAPLLATQFPNFGLFPNVVSAFHIAPRPERNAGVALTLRF